MALRELHDIVVGTAAELAARNDSDPLYDVLLIETDTGNIKIAPSAGDGYPDLTKLPVVLTAPNASLKKVQVANDGTLSTVAFP